MLEVHGLEDVVLGRCCVLGIEREDDWVEVEHERCGVIEGRAVRCGGGITDGDSERELVFGVDVGRCVDGDGVRVRGVVHDLLFCPVLRV